MNRIVILVLCMSISVSSWAGFDEGMAAENKGDHATALKEWQPLAEQGDARAQFNLGFLYAKGYGVSKDEAIAVKWYTKAAEQGYRSAQFFLGMMYSDGNGVPKDQVMAVKWYKKAAEQGLKDAQSTLGSMYQLGWGVQKNDAEALKWYIKAAEQGDTDSQKSIYKMAAIYKNPDAQNQLGMVYQEGWWGYSKDNAEAVKWFTLAAKQGNDLALTFICNLASAGDSTAQKSLTEFASQGKETAQAYLGMMNEVGMGIPRNFAKAAKWYIKLAEEGHPDGQYKVGVMYEQGIGGKTKNKAEAIKWYKKAAAQGQTVAQERLNALL